MLVIELGVNDALPPRSPASHKCLEGLIRAAHAAHAAYEREHGNELAIIMVWFAAVLLLPFNPFVASSLRHDTT